MSYGSGAGGHRPLRGARWHICPGDDSRPCATVQSEGPKEPFKKISLPTVDTDDKGKGEIERITVFKIKRVALKRPSRAGATFISGIT